MTKQRYPTIIMPIAGAGSRFAATGEHQPKPLIKIDGVPMAVWAARSLQLYWRESPIIFVVLKKHVYDFDIISKLKEFLPSAHFAIAAQVTGGSLETCLLASKCVRELGKWQDPVIALDGDLAFKSVSFHQMVNAMDEVEPKADGVLLSFKSSDTRFSYAEVNGDLVLRTAEKKAISENAIVGSYAFRKAEQLFDFAQRMIDSNIKVGNGEFYISEVYNQMIQAGSSIRLAHIDEYWSFGTPEELTECKKQPTFLNQLHQIIYGGVE